MMPVINVILAYGKKTKSLGELRAASLLEDIADGLDQAGHLTPALRELMLRAKSQANALRNQFQESYEDIAAQ